MVTTQSQNVHKLPQKRISQLLKSVDKWFIFMCFVVRIFWRNWLAINSLLVSLSIWNSWLEPFRFHVNCIHFRAAVFVHVRTAQLWKMVFRFTCVVLWNLHG